MTFASLTLAAQESRAQAFNKLYDFITEFMAFA